MYFYFCQLSGNVTKWKYWNFIKILLGYK